MVVYSDILKFLAELPGYPEISSRYTYQLGFRRYPAWSYSCRTSTGFNLMTTRSYLNLRELISFYNAVSIGIYTVIAF
jgi:hypothetical protein